MADTHVRPHQYHTVDPSPWPVVGALSALVLAGGGIMLMHGINNWVFMIGVALLLFTMFGWWHDVIRKAEREGHYTPIVQISMRCGIVLFIASEVMFFAAFFWAYFDISLFPGGAPAARNWSAGPSIPVVCAHRLASRSSMPGKFLPQHPDPADLGRHGDLGAP